MSAELNPAQSASAPQAEWFLARDGQQFGPLSDQELRKLVEMGHLKPSDLLWREGFPEWRSARILLPEAGGAPKLVLNGAALVTAPEPVPQQTASPAPQASSAQSVAPQAVVVQPTAASPAASIAVAQPLSAAQPSSAPTAPSPVVSARPNAAPTAHPASHITQPQQSLAQRAAAAAQATMAQSASAPVAAAPAAYASAQPQAVAPVRAPATTPVRPQAAPQLHLPQGSIPHGSVRTAAQPQPPQHAPAPAPPLAAQHIAPQRPSSPQVGAPMQQPMPQLGPAGYAAPSAPIANPRAAEPPKPAPRLGPQAAAQRARSAAPIAGPDFEEDEHDVPRAGIGRWIARIAIAVFFLATLSAAGLYAYPHRDSIMAFAKGLVPASIASPAAKSPLIGFAPTVEATDAALQGAPLWQVLKREFPEWYGDRVKEASSLSRGQKSEAEIAAQLMAQVMALRRKHAGDALSATSGKLKTVATSLAANLVLLRTASVEACHGFITSGETHVAYLKVLGDPKHTGALQAQLTSVFEAVADGRKVPRVYPQPKQADYNTVVGLLEKRGWTNADMRLFSDSGTFAKTEPEKMCKMVIDWFQAQLEITDGETQLRLLSDALKPVIAG